MHAEQGGIFGHATSCFPDQRWSLPFLLRAAARGRPPGVAKAWQEDEINTDNEQELLQRDEREEEINTDNEQELLQLHEIQRPEPIRPVRLPGLPWDLVAFAEGLCFEGILLESPCSSGQAMVPETPAADSSIDDSRSRQLSAEAPEAAVVRQVPLVREPLSAESSFDGSRSRQLSAEAPKATTVQQVPLAREPLSAESSFDDRWSRQLSAEAPKATTVQQVPLAREPLSAESLFDDSGSRQLSAEAPKATTVQQVPLAREPLSAESSFAPMVQREPMMQQPPTLQDLPVALSSIEVVSDASSEPCVHEPHRSLPARLPQLPEGASQISFSIASSHSVSAFEEEEEEVPERGRMFLPPPPGHEDASRPFADDPGTDADVEVSPFVPNFPTAQHPVAPSPLSPGGFDSESDAQANFQRFSPGSRSSPNSADRRLGGEDSHSCCWLRRADCRFTRSGGSWYCGANTSQELTPLECTVLREVPSRERSALQQLCEEIDASVHEVRHPRDPRERARASDNIPALFTQLSTHLRGYLYQLQEKRCVETVEGCAVVLELFIRAVHLLDVLAPSEEADIVGLGGEATPCFSSLVCDHLNQAMGMHGLIPLCISWLSAMSLLEDLDEEGPEVLASELSFHALMTLQLLLLWSPPSSVSPPEETLIARSGYQAVFEIASGLLSDVENDVPWDEMRLERLTLALDILRLGLRSDAGIDSVCSCRADDDEPSSITLLPLQALQTLALVPRFEEAPGEVVAASLAAAARLLAALLQIPPIARTVDLDRVAVSLRQALQFRPLSLPLTAALRDLLICPSRPRRWFSMGQAAASSRKDLHRAVHRHGVLAELATAATERVRELMKSLRQQQQYAAGRSEVSCRQRGMKDVALASLSSAVVIGAFFDNVEEAVAAVYKKASNLEEMAPLIQLRKSLDNPIHAGSSVPEITSTGWGCLSILSKRS